MKTRDRVATAVLAATLLAVGLWAFLRREPQGWYRLTILPSLGGTETAATGINNRGQVTGFALGADSTCRFFLWDRVHGMQDLGSALVHTTVRINDAGQIAGTTQDAAGNSLAFFWDPARGMQTLGTLGGRESVALGLNNRGQVVGRAQTAAGPSHAFVWDESAGLRDLGTLGGAKSIARSIDDAGLVLGQADSATQEYCPFLWDAAKGMTPAGPALPAHAEWLHMNHCGYVLGADDTHMFLWRNDTGVRKLFPRPATYVQPVVNDANQVLFGRASYSAIVPRWARKILAPKRRCYLWDPVRGEIPLDEPIQRRPGEVFYAWDLNDKGCIVGALVDERRRRARAVLLEPVSERWRK